MAKPDLAPLIRLIERQTRALGLSEREAGRRVGSVGMVANIKKGSMPATDRLFALAQVLGIKGGELQEALSGMPAGAGGLGGVATEGDFAASFVSGFGEAAPPHPDAPATDFVIGEVQAGHWLEASEWPEGDWRPLLLPVDAAYEPLPRFGLLVRGPSMNQLYPDGSVLLCVKLIDLNREPQTGERVIVHRWRLGSIVEATVKEYAERDGQKLLLPRSDHPDHQTPLDLTEGGRAGPEETVEVTALVIGSYRPERVAAGVRGRR